MTAANIHYLIGWIGAIIIVVTIGTVWVLNGRNARRHREEDK